MNMIHNTPFGDIVDTEDDLQPHLYRAFSNAGRVMKLMYAVISTLKVNEEHTKKMAAKSSITVTELADTLSRDYEISFRKAHSIASHIAKRSISEGKELYDWDTQDINKIINEFVSVNIAEDEWKKIISPEYFVEIRSIQGGPSPKEVSRMIVNRKQKLEQQVQEYKEIVKALNDRRKALVEY